MVTYVQARPRGTQMQPSPVSEGRYSGVALVIVLVHMTGSICTGREEQKPEEACEDYGQ